ncbi:MAG: DUF448 domain-containing protein [Sulfurospirillum sp.]|nr:DUF448 domain-containing protein [Sulfurospirillum sp.]
MCIICRGRFEQDTLLRFQINSGKILEFSKEGRSFYMCKNCMCFAQDKLVKLLNGKLKLRYKNIEDFGEYFSKSVREHNKEIITNG